MNTSGDRDAANYGVINTGSGTVNITDSAFGQNPTTLTNVMVPHHIAERPSGQPGGHWHAGVITVLAAETQAFVDVLGSIGSYTRRIGDGGLRFHEARFAVAGRSLRVVATQAIGPGETAAMGAFNVLRQQYHPTIVALAGIAGGLHPSLKHGDVVVAQEVVYYDSRKETPEGTYRRGRSQPVPAHVRRAINDFFSTRGEPCSVTRADPDGKVRAFNLWPGPIGSGSAVIASDQSEVREYLRRFNDKMLAVETEAAGLADAFYQAVETSTQDGWLAVRGISDKADRRKNDKFHRIASWHAMAALTEMLPDLV